MNLRPLRDEEPELGMTPMIDVVFLLLIFFMVSTTFTRTSEISIELPEAERSESVEQPDRVEIAIDAQGRYHVNGRRLVNRQIDTLKAALAAETKDRTEPGLVISADARTPHQAVITAMDAARQLGLVRLTFATRDQKDDAP